MTSLFVIVNVDDEFYMFVISSIVINTYHNCPIGELFDIPTTFKNSK